MLARLLTGSYGDPSVILGLLSRQLFSDSRLLQIFLACRNSFRTQGRINLSYVKDWLKTDASSEAERADFAELLAELTEGK